MKKFLVVVWCSFIFFSSSLSQSTFDKSLNEASADIAGKLSQKNKKKIVVLYVTDINKAQTVAGKYIADVISVNVVNDQGNFEVFDRENLTGIAEAKKMLAEGYIDATKAKELGRILAVEAIVIGNYTVLTKTLKLTLKALDVNSGFVIAATMQDLPLTSDAGALLGIDVYSSNESLNINNINKGFNRPINSNEHYNNPGTVSKNCENKSTGDYCFTNGTNVSLEVEIEYSPIHAKHLSLEPNQTQCIYDFNANPYSFEYYEKGQKYFICEKKGRGSILVEKCKSKTFTIK